MPRQKLVNAVDGMIGDVGRHVAQPGFGVDALSIAMAPSSQQRTKAGHRLRAYMIAAEGSDLRDSLSSAARSERSRSSNSGFALACRASRRSWG
jgi:hypothetical protein